MIKKKRKLNILILIRQVLSYIRCNLYNSSQPYKIMRSIIYMVDIKYNLDTLF